MSRPRTTGWVEDGNGCWIWSGSLNNGGYGKHRQVYEEFVGPIPPGLELDHLCRVRACVNPDHLEPVTRGENLRRKRWHECKNGHRWTFESTYYEGAARRCRTCLRDRMRIYRREVQGMPPAVRAAPDATHCIHGHEFTEENTYISPNGQTRTCRACRRAAGQRHDAKRRRAAA